MSMSQRAPVSAENPLRIAMWSGPRNISTALMRAWENRGDTAVWDEPLYAHYLYRTRLDHPGMDEVIGAGETDWRAVAGKALGPVPGGRPIFYQKHMAHHLLPDMDTDWLMALRNCFLIRDPHEVLLSYRKTREHVTLDDIGVRQQCIIFARVTRLEKTPLVIDAADFLRRPQAMLEAICGHLQVEFSHKMLSWPKGPRASDGIWGKYWYESVWNSTGFAPYRKTEIELDAVLRPLCDQAMPYYEQLYGFRLRL